MPADNNTPRGNPPPLATPAPAAPDRSAKTLWMRQEQLVRLLRSFARGGLAWFLVGIVFAPVREALGGGVWEHVNAIVAALVGIGVAIHAYRTIGDLEPKPPGLPERSPVEARYRAKAKE